MLLFTAVKRKKQTNILSAKSNGTYDKKLACYCVSEWDSRQVQTWTSHSFEKGSFSTQLFKPCSLCEDYLYKEKNTLAKRPQADSLLHHYTDLVYHFAQQDSRPLPILWDQVAESSYCRTSAREDRNSAASNTRVSWGSWAPNAPGLLPLPFATLGQFSDCQWQLLQMWDPIWSVLIRSLQVRRCPAYVRAVSVVEGLWFTAARNSQGMSVCSPYSCVQVQSGAALHTGVTVLLITSYRTNVNPLVFLALYFTFSTACAPVH